MRLPLALFFLAPLGCLTELEPGDELLAIDCNNMLCGKDTGLNEAPSMPGVAIMPNNAQAGDTILCMLWALGYDPEGSKTTHTFGWRLTGSDISATTQSLVVEGEVGDSYQCWSRATDLHGNTGPEGTSETVTLLPDWPYDENIKPPEQLEIFVEDTPDTQALVCVFGSASTSHTQESPVTYAYAWSYREGAGSWQETTLNSAYISGNALTQTGERWRCTITPIKNGAHGDSVSETTDDLDWS